MYTSTNKQTYHKSIIDIYEPAGRNAKIESVFFDNVDKDNTRELIILCSWVQRLQKTAEGKLFETYIYDLKQNEEDFELVYLNEISNHFGIEFEGVQDGVERKAKYKTAIDIKRELKSIGF
ncbi:MAG: hypothetical protein L3J23_06170 [Flavobacteriaceae bacterium]|nr:hypothetical protein [Flavobacteriaceae bacterium]